MTARWRMRTAREGLTHDHRAETQSLRSLEAGRAGAVVQALHERVRETAALRRVAEARRDGRRIRRLEAALFNRLARAVRRARAEAARARRRAAVARRAAA